MKDRSHQSLKGNSFSMGKDDIRLHAYVLKFPTDISYFPQGCLFHIQSLAQDSHLSNIAQRAASVQINIRNTKRAQPSSGHSGCFALLTPHYVLLIGRLQKRGSTTACLALPTSVILDAKAIN